MSSSPAISSVTCERIWPLLSLLLGEDQDSSTSTVCSCCAERWRVLPGTSLLTQSPGPVLSRPVPRSPSLSLALPGSSYLALPLTLPCLPLPPRPPISAHLPHMMIMIIQITIKMLVRVLPGTRARANARTHAQMGARARTHTHTHRRAGRMS